MVKLSKTQIDVLKELVEIDEYGKATILHYMPCAGRFNWNPYWFSSKSMKHIRISTVDKLIGLKFVEGFDPGSWAPPVVKRLQVDHQRARITDEGRDVIKDLMANQIPEQGARKMEMNLSEKEKKALKQLVDLAEQELDRGGKWPELSDALDVLAPVVYPDWKKENGE
jgi:hypothetical protein